MKSYFFYEPRKYLEFLRHATNLVSLSVTTPGRYAVNGSYSSDFYKMLEAVQAVAPPHLQFVHFHFFNTNILEPFDQELFNKLTFRAIIHMHPDSCQQHRGYCWGDHDAGTFGQWVCQSQSPSLPPNCTLLIPMMTDAANVFADTSEVVFVPQAMTASKVFEQLYRTFLPFRLFFDQTVPDLTTCTNLQTVVIKTSTRVRHSRHR